MTMFDDAWLSSVDRTGKVGSRHHVVPRFLLQKWADSKGLVWVKSKHDRKEGIRNIRDLAVTDFYTFIAEDGQLDSTMEELLSVVERHGAAVLKRMNNPVVANVVLTPEEVMQLATFVAFQITRSPRRRRELELMADWYGKTITDGTMTAKVPQEELRALEFVPHQNEHIASMTKLVDPLAQELLARPVFLVTVDRPLFLIGDEPVVVNIIGDHVGHMPDCLVTDEQFARKLKRANRRKARRDRFAARCIYTRLSRTVSRWLLRSRCLSAHVL